MTRRERRMARVNWVVIALTVLVGVTLVPALRVRGWLPFWVVGASLLTLLAYWWMFRAADELWRQRILWSMAVAGALGVVGLADLVVWGLAHQGAVPMLAVWTALVVTLIGSGVALYWPRTLRT